MLLRFLAYVIATLTSYTAQFMNCLHCLLDKTMWNQQFGWLATTPKFKGYTYNRLREKVELQLHDTSLWQLPDSSFWNYFQLFVLWQFRRELWRKGRVSIDPCPMIQLPVNAFNVLEACDKMDQLYPYKNGIYSRLSCQGLCLPYLQQQRIEHQFMPDWHEKQKSERK